MSQVLVRRIARLLAREALMQARPAAEQASTRLGKAMKVLPVVDTPEGASTGVTVPVYWAVFVHDGRGPFGPVSSSFLVFWRDPKKDPRLKGKGRFPKRREDVRRLTRREFQLAMQKNRRARKEGRPPPVLIVKRVRKSLRPQPFFSNSGNMRAFLVKARKIGNEEFRTHVLRTLGKGRGIASGARAVRGIPFRLRPLQRSFRIDIQGGL